MKSIYSLIVVLNMVAISLVAVGFFLQKHVDNVTKKSPFQGVDVCSSVRPKVRLKNLVIVLLDAFRDEFFFKYDTMHRMRALVKNGDAIAFRAQVYHPTVTMPRIKSIISGSISTYSDLIMNFASRKFVGDNVLTIAKEAQKRIVFYGDDTWLSMLPDDIFEARSEGVSSFYVMDYTEVDNNVTRHLKHELSPKGLETWDIMILHYLGLDHVGHSIGGDNPQIHIKLDEMDQIVYNITQNIARHRNNPDEFAIVVLGDHGMTLEGNHGGNSLVETRVPVVVITGNGQTVTNKIHKKESQTTANSIGGNVNSIEPAEFVQQTDVTPTLCALLDLDRLPPASFGLSLHPQINKDQRWAAAKLQSGIHQFQRHLSRLNELTDQRKENLKNALDDCMRKTSLLCRLNNSLDTAVTTFNMCKDVMREIQRESIHKITMSNEDDYAPFSIALSAMVLLLSTFHTFGLNLERFNLNVFLLVFIQPILMFSSSFVEQENEIWYFLFPLFLLKILWDDIVYDRRYGMRKMWNFVVRERWLLAAFVLHRLGHAASDGTCRRWLLFSNEKMIDLGLGSINIKHLDSLLGTTILSEDLQVVVATTNILLLNLAFIWRNARSLRLHCLPAIAGFFAVFVYKLPIGLKLVYIERGIQLVLLWLFLTRNFAVAFTLYVIYLMRPLFLSLFLLCCALGFCIGKIRLIKATDGAFLLLSALSASFYYMGNTVSISSIDIAPGYTGLPFYTPFFVGMQILINTYSGPICVFIGWYQATSYLSASAMTSPGRIREILPALLTHRCTALLTVLAASYHFRYHLFVWTVFTPRLLYEVVHFAVFVLFLGGVLIFVPEPYPKNV